MDEKPLPQIPRLPWISQSAFNGRANLSKEGGRAAWLTVLGSVLVYYSSFGIINSFGFFQAYYQTDFLASTPPSTIAFIGTLQIMLMNLLASVSGALADSYGTTYLYIGSGIGSSGALLALSFSRRGEAWQVFLSQGLLMGFTMAFGVQPALTVAGQHFKRRLALAMGLVSAGSAVGGVSFPIMFQKLLPMVGFEWMLRIAAGKILVCYAIALCISTSKRPGRGRATRWTSLLDFRGFLDLRYSILSAGACFAQLGLWVPYYYIEGYSRKAYPDTRMHGFFLPLVNGTSIVGMIFGGLLGDRLGRLNALYPSTLISGLLCLTLWLTSPTLPCIILFACLYGLCSGFFVALLPACVSQICPEERMGARMGAFYSIVAVSSLVGTPIGGALIRGGDREGYQGLIAYAGCALVVGGLVMIGSRLLHDRDLRRKW
ncbi:MFS general substrate transporter [Pleomassaria siparia CBS 279.74]|uniref:MFS general substrate transporter n=1 Tax=Pleomassaria siparia CBS 279.74 TaxID=1314801 RepID=A0A6G1JWP0_9PLEO|nr:MFS general substrate transporter [Pleomassaria siparia CBS 279.74]